MSIMPLPLP